MDISMFFDPLMERFSVRELEAKSALDEVAILLKGNKEELESFASLMWTSYIGLNLERIREDKESIRNAKKINAKIAKKANELYRLLNQYEDNIDSSGYAGMPDYYLTPRLILDAAEIQEKLDPIKERVKIQQKLFKKNMEPTVKKILAKEDPAEYCPDLRYLMYATWKIAESHIFKEHEERETSPRAFMRFFFGALIGSENSGTLNPDILKLSPQSLADITNIALDLEEGEWISEDCTSSKPFGQIAA